MSLKYPYIDISVTVDDPGRRASVFASEGAPTIELPALGGISEHFMGLADGYLMWHAGTKRGFTYFVFDATESRPSLTITVLLDSDVLVQGRPIVNLIAAVKGRITDGETLTPDYIDRLIGGAGFSEEPLRSPAEAWNVSPGAGVAYRTYSSLVELVNILGFPRQPEYESYKGVVVVPATVLTAAGEALPLISTPIDKALMVVCPEGVEASEMRVSFSDHLTVTYRCDGFEPVSVMFEVGTTNRYVRINGPALVVNNARYAGIVFRRRVPYNVVTLGGAPVDTYTILINGRTATRTDEGFEVSNTDFENGVVKITVSSTNFSSYEREFTPESLEEAAPLEIVLEPESRDVLLRLDFGDGRVVEENLNIEKNTPEYCQLRAGRFHGFRAHRLVGSKPETYNVDVKISAEPAPVHVSPALPFEREADREIEEPAPAVVSDEPSGPVAPVIEKAPSAIWEEKKPERKAPEFANETVGGNDDDDDDDSGINYKKYGIVALVAVAVVALIWVLSKLISGTGTAADGESAVEGDSVNVEQAGAAAGTQTAQPTADEQADIDYLNNNRAWQLSSLKSEKYRSLYNAITAGDIEAIVVNEYFTVKGRATNSDALKAVEMIWNAKGSSQQRSHVKILKSFDSKDDIDLHRLVEDLARRMPPKDEYNPDPRPQL